MCLFDYTRLTRLEAFTCFPHIMSNKVKRSPLAKRLFKQLAKQLDNVSESTEHISKSSQYVSELDVSETTR